VIRMWKRLAKVLFAIVLILCALLLLHYNKARIPSTYFYGYLVLVGVYIILQVSTQRVLEKRFGAGHIVLRIFNVVDVLLVGCLIFLFAMYIYPGR
jgi:hypothetical protein